MNVTEISKKPEDIWDVLITQGGVDEQGYDQGLVKTLKKTLGLKFSSTVKDGLKIKSISNEMFLKALFTSLEPYGKMYVDLMSMFQAAEAQMTEQKRNLYIQFDFGLDNNFGFDTKEFKAYVEKWKKVWNL